MKTELMSCCILMIAAGCGDHKQPIKEPIHGTLSSGCTSQSYPITADSGSTYRVATGAGAVASDVMTGRNYLSFVPPPVAGSIPGLVFYFHGTVDGAPPGSGLEPIAPVGSPAVNALEANGHFAVVYFNAEIHNDADTTYIYGYNTPGVRAWDQRNPSLNSDVPYVRSVYSTLERSLCFDTGKVFVHGFSSGGFFANNLANFQPIPGVTIKGAGIDHGGLIQGASFVNTAAPQASGAMRIFLNTNDGDMVVRPSVTAQAQSFWSAAGVTTKLVYTGAGHVPMDDTTLAQMADFFFR